MESDEKKLLTNAGYKLVCSNPREKLFFPQSSYFGDRYLCGGISGRSNSVSKASSAGPDTRRSTINSYMMATLSYRFYSLPMDLMKRTEYPSTGSRISGQHNHHYHHHHVHNNNNNNNTNSHHPENERVDPTTISKIPKDHKGYKNVFVVGVAFMFVYTAFVSLQSLQSTLNTDDGVGVVSLSCMYSATVFSCLIAPWVINKLKCKWTMVVAFVLFSCYFAANFYPKHFMLIPAGIILGLLTGPLWSAQATLVTTLGITYAQRNQNYDADAVVNKFMGIFYAFYQASQIWGNIITAAVLYSNDTLKATPDADMWLTTVSTANRSSSLLTTYATYSLHNPSPLSPSSHSSMSMSFPLLPTWKKCGSKFCGLLLADPGAEYRDYNPIIEGISDDSRHMLLGVYLICGIMGAIIMMALMDNEGQNKEEEICGCVSSRELCLATIKMLGDYRCQLLIPLVLFLGLQQGFLFGDFTKSYVQCTLGIYSIGLILITFGLVNAISSVVIGYIAKHIKRFAFITAAATFNAGILMVLSLWKPQPLDIPNFYVVAACLGLCDAIWQTQTFTLFGVLFMDRQEAAFASYRMFHATGCAIAFGYSYFFCVVTKVYILAVVMGVSLIAYGAIEIKLQLHRQNIKDIVAL